MLADLTKRAYLNVKFDFRAPKTLVNNIYFPKVKVALSSTKFVLPTLFKCHIDVL